MAQFVINNRPEPIEFEIGDNDLARTLQNAKNLLMTEMGEVPYDRYRGLDPAILHLPFDQMRYELTPEIDRVMLWEPDVGVVEATAVQDDEIGTLITVILECGLEE